MILRHEQIRARIQKEIDKLGQHWLISEAVIIATVDTLNQFTDTQINTINVEAFLLAKTISAQIPEPDGPVGQIISLIRDVEEQLKTIEPSNPLENIISSLNILNGQLIMARAKSHLKK